MVSNMKSSSRSNSAALKQREEELPDRNIAEVFYSQYELKEVLGRGLSSVVRRCVRHDNGEEYAVKIIDVSGDLIDHDGLTLREQVMREVHVLRRVAGHKYIIELLEVFDMKSVVFLVFELCPKGELFDLLTDKVVLTQKTARRIMRQILEAVHHCHQLSVVHRDVKPENILLDENFNVKLTDFGFAKQLQVGDRLREVCGTPGYLAPEILNSGMLDPEVDPGYSYEVDEWACGVTLYTMLSGHPPFWHRNQYKLIRQITRGQYSFNLPEWSNIAEETKDLVAGLLTVDPKRRLTVAEALMHPEFTSPGQFRKEVIPEQEPVEQQQSGTPAEVARMLSAVAGRRVTSAAAPILPEEPPEAPQINHVQEIHAVVSVNQPHNTFRSAAQAVRSLVRLQRLQMTPLPVSLSVARIQPYSVRELRGVIDNTAFKLYSHWVKRSEGQNRAALFEHTLRSDAKKRD